MSSIRCIGSIAFSAISLSTITSGSSYLSVLYNFFIVFNRMKLHSLQAHVLSLGGAGINSLSGLFFFISCNIPDSVATMKRLQSDCVAKRKSSVEKQLWLPESTNDFIFSVVCEELGFIGAVLIIVLFVLFIVQGLLIAYKAENLYCTMVGIGIMAQIAWQVFCNIAVVTNTLPNTGISLPFFSSGGTSLILLLAEMGVMVNIGRNGERAAQQREQMRAQREAARAEREAELARKTIDLASARAARTEQ